jgi:hypothetical protein
MSDWFTVTRSSGEKGGIGEFVVEDAEGVEWQVTAVNSTKKEGAITFLNEVVCMNRMYDCSWELRYDLHDAVRNFIEGED